MRYVVCLESDYKEKILSAAGRYDMIVIDAQDYSAAEISKLKAGGAEVLSYLNVGAVEKDRPYFSAVKAADLIVCKYDGWDDEYWVKAQSDAWRKIILEHAAGLLAKGIDGFWCDNLDVFYMAAEEWEWSSEEMDKMRKQLVSILADLKRSSCYVMVNGGDVFVSYVLIAQKIASECIDGINQETVFSSITSYDGDGKFGKQDPDDRKYFQSYCSAAKNAGLDVCLMEYTNDESIRAEAEKYCSENGFSLMVSNTLKLGKDIQAAVPDSKSKGIPTVYDALDAMKKYDGYATVNDDVRKDIKTYAGKTVGSGDAWDTQVIMAAFARIRGLSLLGGYATSAKAMKANALKLGIYRSGKKGILPGDIVLYGSGEPNHVEFAVGNDVNIDATKVSGKNDCRRIKRTGRAIKGYIRPKYAAMPEMDNLQVTIAACDVMLNVYGSGDTRKEQLSVFGATNSEKIQAEVTRVWNDDDKKFFDLAVYVINGNAGIQSYRKSRLGSFASRTQDKVEDIYSLHTHLVEEAARDVWNGFYGNGEVRKRLLRFNGYDPEIVQTIVDTLNKQSAASGSEGSSASVVSLFRDAPRDTKYVDGLQGNLFVIKDHDSRKALGLESMRAGAVDRIKAELSGYEHVEWLCTHPHSDHMGNNVNSLVKAGLIKKLYLPTRSTIASDYIDRFDKIVSQCAKYGTKVVYLKQGDHFSVGSIDVNVIFQQTSSSTDSVNMKSLCLMIKAGGKRILYCGDHHCGKKESKLNVTAIGHVDVLLSSHHQLYTGDTDSFVGRVTPDWIIGAGWKSWPLGTVEQDEKVKAAQKTYQKYGNLLPGDIVGRTELKILDGTIDATGEKNMASKEVRYALGGKTYTKTVHVCRKTAFQKVASMIPNGAKYV